MKKISLLACEEAEAAGLVMTLEMLELVNQYGRELGIGPYFELETVSLNGSRELKMSRYVTFTADMTFKDLKDTDIIVVPPVYDRMTVAMNRYNYLFAKLREYHEQGVELVSFCTGAFLLAESGLLDNREATTHTQFANNFKKSYPCVNLQADKICTDHEGIYTSGGALSSINLMVYLVNKHCGREAARWVSHFLAIDITRTTQLQFQAFQGRRDHGDELITRAQDFLEENYNEEVSMTVLAEDLAVSPRNFIRRFKKATQDTPIQYLQKVRIEKAKTLFENSQISMKEVIEKVGYSDITSFSKLFTRSTGMTPAKYRKVYRENIFVGAN